MLFTLNAEALIRQNKQLGLLNSKIEPMPKQPYTPPTVKLALLSTRTLNNSSGGGDGDSALANS